MFIHPYLTYVVGTILLSMMHCGEKGQFVMNWFYACFVSFYPNMHGLQGRHTCIAVYHVHQFLINLQTLCCLYASFEYPYDIIVVCLIDL